MKKIILISALFLTGIFLIQSCTCTKFCCPNNVVPKKLIDKKRAVALQQNYIKKQNGKKEDLDFWWSIEDLKAYICYVEQQTKNKHSVSGFRFYMGTREDGRNTLFFVPTEHIVAVKSLQKKSADTTSASSETLKNPHPDEKDIDINLQDYSDPGCTVIKL